MSKTTGMLLVCLLFFCMAASAESWSINPRARFTRYEKTHPGQAEWGNGDMRLHHLWWFSRFPHHPGTFEGKLANWWKYIFAWDEHRNL
ncbi:MAG: hypothetical protein PHD82_09945 [Candidatus Riflebacteria bacterium]|jgi:hypothetical protein|nr:hypothetical protein [Candidatus Riflebacteria bacterium]